ncbi:MAG: SGNH/GDSL hydrolase family protein [Methylococcales bacterium]
MKTILCYGDSNTWGYIPGTGKRYPFPVRWTSILAKQLGENFRVIDEGLSGRYTVWDEPFRPGRNGAGLLLPILQSHQPLDLVIVMLGTNDVLHFKDNTAYDAARGAALLVDIIQKSTCGINDLPPQVLLVSPPLMSSLSAKLALKCHGLPEKSAEFAHYYAEVAQTSQCFYLDAAGHCQPSSIDGVHLDESGHYQLGLAVSEKIKSSIYPDQLLSTK